MAISASSNDGNGSFGFAVLLAKRYTLLALKFQFFCKQNKKKNKAKLFSTPTTNAAAI